MITVTVVGEVREEAVYVFGTNEMSTRGVLQYFMEYGPSHLEWVNDSSCKPFAIYIPL